MTLSLLWLHPRTQQQAGICTYFLLFLLLLLLLSYPSLLQSSEKASKEFSTLGSFNSTLQCGIFSIQILHGIYTESLLQTSMRGPQGYPKSSGASATPHSLNLGTASWRWCHITLSHSFQPNLIQGPNPTIRPWMVIHIDTQLQHKQEKQPTVLRKHTHSSFQYHYNITTTTCRPTICSMGFPSSPTATGIYGGLVFASTSKLRIFSSTAILMVQSCPGEAPFLTTSPKQSPTHALFFMAISRHLYSAPSVLPTPYVMNSLP